MKWVVLIACILLIVPFVILIIDMISQNYPEHSALYKLIKE